MKSDPPAITVFVCGRPKGPRAACSRPGCVRGAELACSYPVNRRGESAPGYMPRKVDPETCGANLCVKCARPGGGGSLCGPHADLLARKAAAKP